MSTNYSSNGIEGADFDEFGEKTVLPFLENGKNDKPWRGCGPTYDGEWTLCFDESYLFSIVNHKEKKWAFYNDTSEFEMHIMVVFGRDSRLQALGDTQITVNERGEHVATTVVYPSDTVMFVSGAWGSYRSYFERKSLSKKYLERIAQDNEETVKKAMAVVSRLCPSGDAESLLRTCILNKVLFVDLEFPPTLKSLDADKKILRAFPWYRPSDYLPENYVKHVSLFRMPITPCSIKQSNFCDFWVVSAMAILAENPERVKNIFRHPVRRTETAKEASVGAYRVLLNKDGMWKSYLVDDYLPVVGSRPRFAYNKNDPCELWISLLEKAYAKRNGGFVNILSGDSLIALRDFTGYPTSRFDKLFFEAQNDLDVSVNFFTRLLALYNAGHTILFNTPANGFEGPQVDNHKEVGIPVGYALAVLRIKYISGFRLLCLRNPWGNVSQWKGNWSPSSHLWRENPDVAAACTDHDGSNSSLWMDWDDVKSHFVGCGVVFNCASHYDYRIPGIFTDAAPSVCLEVSVKSPITLFLILSQPDHRGMDKESVDYDPIMLSVARSEKKNKNEFTVIASTSADTQNPTERHVFLHGRDVSMIYELLPEQSPYLVLPRRIGYSCEMDKMLPFTLGLLSPKLITETEGIEVLFKALPASNEVFEDYLQFVNDGEVTSVTYQLKHPNSLLNFVTGEQIK